jgi:hypothetical protein
MSQHSRRRSEIQIGNGISDRFTPWGTCNLYYFYDYFFDNLEASPAFEMVRIDLMN